MYVRYVMCVYLESHYRHNVPIFSTRKSSRALVLQAVFVFWLSSSLNGFDQWDWWLVTHWHTMGGRGHMMRCHGDLPRGNYLCHETHYCVSSRDTCATWHTKLRKWTLSGVCGVTYPGGVLPGVIWNGSWSIKSDKNTHTHKWFLDPDNI